ncbi:hypothetical protein O181_062474 [Austropuccinia psidii MF-1]|uniref:Uncharacterized protein n=1 Tax=Austropuccinia psidii MF-1 TaxID=1389203 RepID=A0A9Q3I1L0_9BASI|nr:hypothetical protein [Austropuccinia psidii MF-1]
MPHEQTLWQPTPGPSGTQLSEDLFCGKQKAVPFLILPFKSSELTLPPFVEPSQNNEPPILGPSKASDSQLPSHESALTIEPEPEVHSMQSTKDPFAPPATPCSIIIIDNMPVKTPPPLLFPISPLPPVPSP